MAIETKLLQSTAAGRLRRPRVIIVAQHSCVLIHLSPKQSGWFLRATLPQLGRQKSAADGLLKPAILLVSALVISNLVALVELISCRILVGLVHV